MSQDTHVSSSRQGSNPKLHDIDPSDQGMENNGGLRFRPSIMYNQAGGDNSHIRLGERQAVSSALIKARCHFGMDKVHPP